jgi:NhaA family Na+:H+ antiporter
VSRRPTAATLPPAQLVAQKVFSTLQRFLHVEAVSGIVLLVAAATALIWANSPAADAYHHVWDAPVSIALGRYSLTQSLHFVVNDALMSIFFLVVGMEIRREMHEGALSNVRIAALPLAGAFGGVAVPAVIYLAINNETLLRDGWAIPTATDIAFAVGVLALLGRSIPGSIRIFLLALAIIDDIAAVIIIAAFYSGGLDYSGLVIAAVGILLVLGLQQIGIGAAYIYVVPGAILWFGLLKTGAHPALAGVVLGLMTPVAPPRARERSFDVAARALDDIGSRAQTENSDPRELLEPLEHLYTAQPELLAPVVRVQTALHPWVAYGVMPLFALANAGVSLEGIDLNAAASQSVMLGVIIALVVGKPLGIVAGSWIAVRLGWCQLPPGVTWQGVSLVGCLGGIGFTMSIFIATLAFRDEGLLEAAKFGVLLASLAAGIVGLTLGRSFVRRARLGQGAATPSHSPSQDRHH